MERSEREYLGSRGALLGSGGGLAAAPPPGYKRRETKVYHIWDWPRGVRKRGWGLLHDQIWFYDDPSGETFGAEVHNEIPELLYQAKSGKWWRREIDGRWLRLYMDRRMLWLPRSFSRIKIGAWRLWNRIRIHWFFSGDDEGAPHDHPWGFVTFPLADYTETLEIFDDQVYSWDPLTDKNTRYVGYVSPSGDEREEPGKYSLTLGSPEMGGSYAVRVERVVKRFRFHSRPAEYRHYVHEPAKPFRTIVLAAEVHPRRDWGFWPLPSEFVSHSDRTTYE